MYLVWTHCSVNRRYYWATSGAQLWNELSQSKKDKMADGSPRGGCVSHSPSIGLIFAGRGQVISRRPDLEVDLERTQNYFVELSALYPN